MVEKQRTASTPTLVNEGRSRINQGQRRPENNEQPRPYYCRNCGKEVQSIAIPRGWYLISRARGNWEKHARLGLYCSADCITGQVPRMQGIEKNLGDRWDDMPSPYQQT